MRKKCRGFSVKPVGKNSNRWALNVKYKRSLLAKVVAKSPN
jgi:hypothetical protein